MKKILLTLLLVLSFYGCRMVEPKVETASIKNKTTSEICIIENYIESQWYFCDEGDKKILYNFQGDTIFHAVEKTNALIGITVVFLGDENLCYVFDDESNYSVFKDIRLLSSYQYNEQYSMYEYTITEELKNASSLCTEKLPWEEN